MFPDPTRHSKPNPTPTPGLCPGFSHDFPAIERDYMGIGLGLQQEIAKDNASLSTTSCPTKNQQPSASICTLADNLCGSHLKLAPPSSSADDGSHADFDANDEEEHLSGNVGWPPISSYRKSATRSLSIDTPCHTGDIVETLSLEYPQAPLIHETNNHDLTLGNDACSRVTIEPSAKMARISFHIKVGMDGTPIMRKVDLESMQGYQHLSLELHKLFRFYRSNLSCEVGVQSNFKESGDADYILSYKDKDGEWMLVGETPWETFAHTARRLRIVKKAK
ncbi:hypothetical protein L7F22_016368 [Adiantum nelumboides]|nr:hypothetical protein [Adiantum nelumboides]